MSYILRRLEFFVITLWAALTINFILPRLMPGSPAEAMLANFHGRVSPQAIKPMEIAFGINTNQSVVQQYLEYLVNTARGDLGLSIAYFPQSVGQSIMLALPWTVALVGVATVIAFVLGTLVGILSAWRRGGVLDGVLPTVFIVVSAFPYFWLGLILIFVL